MMHASVLLIGSGVSLVLVALNSSILEVVRANVGNPLGRPRLQRPLLVFLTNSGFNLDRT